MSKHCLECGAFLAKIVDIPTNIVGYTKTDWVCFNDRCLLFFNCIESELLKKEE